MTGWVKLHRKMLDWEWYDDPNTFRLFITLIMMANHADKKWRGATIKKGSMITGLYSLSKKTGLSVSQLRTSINKLILTGEVTSKTSNKYRVITISNWEVYQQDDKQDDKQLTDKSQASDKQVTTNKNDKELKNDKEYIHTPLAMLVNMNVNEKIAQEWLKVRRTKKLTSTQTAFNVVNREAEKAGLTMNQAVTKSVEESWGGFKAEWLNNQGAANGKNKYTNATDKHQEYLDRLKAL